MMYFTNFPSTYYEIQASKYGRPAEYVTLTDITRNVRFKKEVLNRIVINDSYIISDGQTIEQVSEELYGSPYYHWLLMLLNDRFDYINDLPLATRAFESYVEKKYNFETEDGPYLDAEYGLTPQNLVVDIVNSSGQSVDFTVSNVRVIDRRNNAVVFRDISSASKYDPELKMQVKTFLYLDYYTDTTALYADTEVTTADYYAGTYNPNTAQYVAERTLDTTTHRLDWGTVPLYTPIYLYDYEMARNESKREIKVLSESLMQLALQNFKDLM